MPTKSVFTAGCALLAAGAAQALTIDFKPLAHVEVIHDDNIFRAPDNSAAGGAGRVADTVTRYGAGASLKLTQSLQTLTIDGDYDRVDYASQNQLNHNRYRLGAALGLAAGSSLHLNLKAAREHRLENFAYRHDSAKGFIDQKTAGADFEYAITPRYSLVSSGNYYSTRATLASSQDFDVIERGVEGGLRYGIARYSGLDLIVRDVHGDFPSRVVTAGDGREKKYEQQSAFMRLAYAPSGLTDLRLQAGYTRRQHQDASVSDFKGATGRFSLLRRISGRSQLRFDAYRDLYYVQQAGANYVENLGVDLGFDYLYSAKLKLAATVERIESRYRGASSFAQQTGGARSDELLGARIGAEYQPFYRFSITPSYRFERRNSTEALSQYYFNSFGVDFAYRYGAESSY